MYEYNESRDIFLFENDFSNLIYGTDEGKAVFAMLDSDEEDRTIRKEGVTAAELQTTLEHYWNTRNGTEIFHIDGVEISFRDVVNNMKANV